MPLLLAGLVAAFFWKILFLRLAVGGLDVLEYFFAYRAYAAQSIRSLRLPLWNPDHFAGAPFLANIQTAVLYPPSGLFYLLDFPTAYTWSVVLHVFLGGLFAYVFARQSLTAGRVPALLSAMAFSFGGFLGGQTGHLNQLSAAVWLPALLLCWDKATGGRWGYALAGALVVGMQFLAGHSQESYLMLLTLVLYATYETVARSRREGGTGVLWGVAALILMLALGSALAAVQLLPTAELASWSVRAEGLSYELATTFSLKPTMLFEALLPPFRNRAMIVEPGGTEFLGYIGVTGLVLAVAGLAYARRRQTYFWAAVGAVAVFLALGKQNPFYPAMFKLVPGFDLLRVPARWLFLFDFSAAMLAALGADALLGVRPKLRWRPLAALVILFGATMAAFASSEELPPVGTRLAWAGFGAVALAAAFVLVRVRNGMVGSGAGAVLVALLASELWLASQSLDYNHPTAPRLFEDSIATLDFLRRQPGGYRSLSVARDTYVPAIEQNARENVGPALGDQDLLAYLSYYKLREILEPNTTLAVDVPTIDGYDGGLLPLARYEGFKDVLTERPSAPDDRIRFVVKWLPNQSALNLAGVRYILMDGLSDAVIDGVRYDLSSFIHLNVDHPRASLRLAQAVPASAIGIVLAAKSVLSTDAVLGSVTVLDEQGGSVDAPLRAGGASVGQLPFAEELPTALSVGALPGRTLVRALAFSLEPSTGAELFVNGIALLGGSEVGYSPLASAGAEMRRVYEGDVKIYENSAALGPAFLLHDVRVVGDAQSAFAELSKGIDPSQSAVVEADAQPPPSRSLLGRIIGRIRRALPLRGAPFAVPSSWLEPQPLDALAAPDVVTILAHRPEHLAARTESARDGFLIVTQAFYPGWQAAVDGQPARLLAADGLFQAVRVPAGRHVVELNFKPRSIAVGAAVSAVAALLIAAGFVLGWRRA